MVWESVLAHAKWRRVGAVLSSLVVFGLHASALAATSETFSAEIETRFDDYLSAFNAADPEQVASFWSDQAVSLNEETGERLTGRDAVRSDFAAFFERSPGARLTARIDEARLVRPEVAIVEGQATLYAPGDEPTVSAFTAVLVRTDGAWLIDSSHERDLPAPPTPREALRELEWLVGSWRDDVDGADVATSVRWSPNEAFLIRSFNVRYEADASYEGTQVIGWDPAGKQIRTWTFLSDGSFGQGVASRSGDDWLLKSTLTLPDGREYAGTQVVSRPDSDTMRIEKIGQTIDGEPLPASEPVTVVRVTETGAPLAAEEGAP